MLNVNNLFINSKEKTRPIYKIPKNVRQALNIADVDANGVFKIEEGKNNVLYDCCFVFDDINYINQDIGAKENILLQLCGWLNSMKTDFKICVCNEYQDMNSLIKKLFSTTHENAYPMLATGMEQWVNEKITAGTPNIKKLMYLVVTTKARSFEDANAYFNMLETQLQMMFYSWNSKLIRLPMTARLEILEGFLRGKKEDIDIDKHNFKTDILPSSIKSYKNYMELDNLCVSVLHGFRYKKGIDEGKFLYRLSSMSYPSIVTIDYATISSELLEGKLGSARKNNEKAIADELEWKNNKGLYAGGISYEKEKQKLELEEYTDQVEQNDENCFFVGLLIMVTAPNDAILRQRIDSVIDVGYEQGVALEIYNYRQLKALNTVLPFGGRQVDHMRTMLTSSVVALQPYYAVDVIENNGYIYGSNRTTKKLMVGNRKKLKNPHGFICGHSGSGKSMHIKITEIAQTILRTNDDVIVIDPQNEFEKNIKDFNGIYFDFTPKSKIHLNPLEIPESIYHKKNRSEIEKFVEMQVEFLQAFCESIMVKIEVTQIHNSYISKVTKRMYQRSFDRKLLRQPTLLHFYKELQIEMKNLEMEDEKDRERVKEIYASLEEYVSGAYDMFSKPSNVELDNRLIGFGLNNVSKKNWEPMMLIIINFLKNRMEYNKSHQRATHFIVDEGQRVCEHDSSAEMILDAFITFRKFGGICTLCMQNMTRALENAELRDMFSNCEYKVFFDQGGVDAHALAEIQELTSTEFRSLAEEIPGHGVMVWGKKVILLDSYMEQKNILYQMFSTNFHEQVENKLENAE